MTTTEQLLALANVYGAHTGLTRATVGTYVMNDGKFFSGLAGEGVEKPRSCTLRTAERVLTWFSDHWPSDLPWPADVPRPKAPRPAKAPKAEARP